ncbi:hypothetical protein NHX12_025117 [Muraenolepis orangiensis]|uniref:Uncharacterized protein n=1 Tax=Muraenolepis orangiensis TaxID=630683 RepID=A0A9Q0IPC7_9TELE|nr:hypothetical protein NHX12_025117 [Muraenolepis orangiensis]
MGPGGVELGQQHPYPALSQLADVYEHHHQQQLHLQQLQQPCKEVNKYASLKAVGECLLAETRGDQGRPGETRGDKGRQRGDQGRPGETRGDQGRRGETRGDKGRDEGRQGETRGDNGRQGETRGDKEETKG